MKKILDEQRQLLEDFTAVFDEEFSAELRDLFARGLVYFAVGEDGEPDMLLTPLGVLVVREMRKQEKN